MLDDGQTETRSARIARARFVDAIEPLEDAGEILLRNACLSPKRLGQGISMSLRSLYDCCWGFVAAGPVRPARQGARQLLSPGAETL